MLRLISCEFGVSLVRISTPCKKAVSLAISWRYSIRCSSLMTSSHCAGIVENLKSDKDFNYRGEFVTQATPNNSCLILNNIFGTEINHFCVGWNYSCLKSVWFRKVHFSRWRWQQRANVSIIINNLHPLLTRAQRNVYGSINWGEYFILTVYCSTWVNLIQVS